MAPSKSEPDPSLLPPLGYLSMALMCSVIWSGPAGAATAGPRIIDEVLVTARKQSETVQEVPVAIQAISREDLDRFNTTAFSELADLANQVEITPNPASNGGSFTIRGYGAVGADAGAENGVSVNIDGIQTARGHISRLAFFDLEAVEILKGPQALYFGKDSPGGVIALKSALPTEEFSSRVSLGYETVADEYILEAMVSGPLTDTLSARLAYRGTRMDGWLKNNARFIQNSNGEVVPGDPFDLPGASGVPGAEDVDSFRLTLDWNPTDQFRAIGRLLWVQLDSEGFQTGESVNCATGESRVQVAGFPPPGFIVDPFDDCKLNGRVAGSRIPTEVARAWSHDVGDGQMFGKLDTILASVELQWDFAWGNLTSVTGYYDYDFDWFEQSPWNSLAQLICACPEEQEQWTQEVRFSTAFDGPFNFRLGAFYEDFERSRIGSVNIASFGFDPITGFSNHLSTDQLTDGTTKSVFGAVIWDINDHVELSMGGRYSRDKKVGNNVVTYVHLFFQQAFPGPGTEIPATLKTTNFSPEVTLTWRPSTDLTVWGAYKTGYKSGGYANPLIVGSQFNQDNITFEPEEAEGGEVGIKASLLDRRARINVTAYTYEFKDLQVTAFNRFPPSFFIQNAATSRSRGFEVDAQYLATPELALNIQFGYNRYEFLDFQGAQCYPGQPVSIGECDPETSTQDLSGRRAANAPEWSGSAGFEYSRQLNRDWRFWAAASAIYTSDVNADTTLAPQAENGSEWRYNARLSVERADGRWAFSMIGRNLSDQLGRIAAQRSGGVDPEDQLGGGRRGRQILFQATYTM